MPAPRAAMAPIFMGAAVRWAHAFEVAVPPRPTEAVPPAITPVSTPTFASTGSDTSVAPGTEAVPVVISRTFDVVELKLV